MGLYCDLIRLDDQEIEKCLELNNQEDIYALIQQNREHDWFDLDKAWHGIHFILNKPYPTEIAPLNFILQGGLWLTNRNWEDIYGIDVPDMRAFYSAQVKYIFTALSSVTDREFKYRYDPNIMLKCKIYPYVWEEQKYLFSWILAKYLKFSIHLDYLVFHFKKLQTFIAKTVDHDWGLIIKYHQ